MLKEKILKRLTFVYGIEGEEVKKGSIFVGYYKDVPVEDEKFNKFYYILNKEQKKLFF